MSVETQHPEYTEKLKQWIVVKALAEGSSSVKNPHIADLILRNPDDQDTVRFAKYVKSSIYTNFTGRTRVGLTGAAFREEPKINDLPDDLQFLEDDADSCGLGLNQLAKGLLSDLLTTGREVLLVDYPETEGGLTLAQTKDINPKILRYSAVDFINWKDNLMVLREAYNDSEDEFLHDTQFQYRVLRLTPDGCTQQIYRKNAPYTEETSVRDASGKAFEFIPAVVVGAQNNDLSVDEIPLADIAHVNAGHFQNSADLEENCHIHGQLTMGIQTELDHKDFKEANPSGVKVGALSGIFLGESGAFHKLQAEPNALADNLMLRKESMIIQLGGRIVESRGTNTATEARIDATGENSVLGDLVGNVEEGINKCIEWCGMFKGVVVSDDLFKMNRQFFDDTIDPQSAIAAMNYYDRGLITKPDIAKVAKKAGFVHEDTTDDELLEGMADPGIEVNVNNDLQDDEEDV